MSNSAHQAVEVYTQGTKAWFADDKEAWVSTTCVSNTVAGDSVRIVFQSDHDDQVKYFDVIWQLVDTYLLHWFLLKQRNMYLNQRLQKLKKTEDPHFPLSVTRPRWNIQMI